MRGYVSTLVVLSLVGYFASTVHWPDARGDKITAAGDVNDQWRRTKDGWERRKNWMLAPPSFESVPIAWRIHPVLIALVQLLVALLALAWPEIKPSLFRRQPAG